MRSVCPHVCVLVLALAFGVASPGWSEHDGGCETHPRNDELANAEELPFLPYATTGTTTCATAQPGEPDTWCEGAGDDPRWSDASVWYRYRPAETSRVTVHVFGVGTAPPSSGPFPAAIHVYEGDSFDAKKYACGFGEPAAQASFLAVERKIYTIQVSPAFAGGPPGESGGDFVLVLAPRVETDPREILP